MEPITLAKAHLLPSTDQSSDFYSTRKRLDSERLKETFSATEIVGSCSIRVFGVLGCIGTFALGLHALIGDLREPWDILIHVYICFFSVVGILLESVQLSWLGHMFLRLRIGIEFWAKFLTRAWGKSCFYMLLGSIIFSKYTFLWLCCGAYMICVSLFFLMVSYCGSRKLREIREECENQFEQNFETLLHRCDIDGDGKLNCQELDYLSDELGVLLSASELQVIVNYLDFDRDGKIGIDEFKQWYFQNKLPSLI